MDNIPILIIDDEPGVLEGLSDFLGDEGYEVHQAMDARRGLEIFRSVDPDLVMTDLRMPGMSGIELIQEIRRQDKTTPIIVVTGYGDLDSAIEAIRLEVFDFITKPIDLDFLKGTLDRARQSLKAAERIEQEIEKLRREVFSFQSQWKDQISKLSEMEPLIYAGRLLSGILHNLNNPLTYIMGQAELLKMLHPEIENIAVIQEQAARMKKIMSTITKRVKESQSKECCWIQLNDILKEEMFFLESHPGYYIEVETEWRLANDLPLIEGVPADFSQIFGNIFRNAVEAMMKQPTKKLVISTWHDEAEVHVSIRDNGPGISSHLVQKIFEPFFSTKNSESDRLGGVGIGMGIGIGLYHCRELVREYGGEIEVVSSPGEGANFIVHLPKGPRKRSG